MATTIEPSPTGGGESGAALSPQEGAAFEVQIEDLRPLVRALVAEEIERWLRRRGECP
jgi:hypothetical protein